MAERPNIVVIMVDQWRGDCLSVAGHPVVQTPYLDQTGAGRRALWQRLLSHAHLHPGARGAIHRPDAAHPRPRGLSGWRCLGL